MPSSKDLTNTWNTIKEIDLRPLQEEANRVIEIDLVGRTAADLAALADKLRSDPSRPGTQVGTPIPLLSLNEAQRAAGADLIILMLPASERNNDVERLLARNWAETGKRVLVFLYDDALQPEGTSGLQVDERWVDWKNRKVVSGSLSNDDFLQKQFVKAMMELLPERHLSLARHFPLARQAVANALINDICFSNAAYSLSTGLAEIVPIFDIPLNVTDMFVLSKTQAFLVYKLGLALGMSMRWQDYLAEFGSVLGGGFFWRQVARSLIGLVPVWGIIPKTAVAFAGTYVVGHVVLGWYLTGRQLSREQMRQLYSQALERGKVLATSMVKKLPAGRKSPGRQKPSRGDKQADKKLLADGEKPRQKKLQRKLPGWRRREEKEASGGLVEPKTRTCPKCGKDSAADASFCQYCGENLADAAPGAGV